MTHRLQRVAVLAASALFISGSSVPGTPVDAVDLRPGHTTCVLLADPHDKFTRVRPARIEHPDGAELATISVTYNGFTPEAQYAFQYAVEIWKRQVTSSVPIQVIANWTPLGAGVLGSAGPGDMLANFQGAPRSNTWYAVGLANKLRGADLRPNGADIIANFNSAGTDWYFGTDGNTPAGKYDLVTAILHELAHGLGFFGLWEYSGGNGTWGEDGGFGRWPSIYDGFLENTAGTDLITGFANGSAALGTQITTPNNIMFWGLNAVAANGGFRPTLSSPSTWNSASSLSHLDEAVYPAGTLNSLMSPMLGSAEAIHDPGPITRGIFKDEGWTVFTPSPSTSDKIVLALTPYPNDGGWIASRTGAGGGFAAGPVPWARTPWDAYNAGGYGSRVAAGDVDGDGLDEVIVGLDTGGWIAVLDDAAHNFALMRWIQVPWADYNALNGSVYPAAGDIDNDGKAEIVAGFGLSGGGYIAIFDDASAGYGFMAWRMVPWSSYNRDNGSTRPAVANLDGFGASEIVVGLGSGSAGWLAVFSGYEHAYAHQAWMQVPWPSFNEASGSTFPAAGDIDGDGKAEIVVGLGGGDGYVYIFDDSRTGYSGIGWRRTSWAAFNEAGGTVFPAVGDIDGDGRAEIVFGLGEFHPGAGGWFEIIDDSASGLSGMGWRNIGWSAFSAYGGGLLPAIGNFR